jgi:hypothetical protein
MIALWTALVAALTAATYSVAWDLCAAAGEDDRADQNSLAATGHHSERIPNTGNG